LFKAFFPPETFPYRNERQYKDTIYTLVLKEEPYFFIELVLIYHFLSTIPDRLGIGTFFRLMPERLPELHRA